MKNKNETQAKEECPFTQRFNLLKQYNKQVCNNSKENGTNLDDYIRLTDHISNYDSRQYNNKMISHEKVSYGTTIPPHLYATANNEGK